MKTCKRILAVLLAALLFGSILSVGALAAEHEFTEEQSLEVMNSVLRLTAIPTHAGMGLIFLKSGKTKETLHADFTKNWKALAADKGLDAELMGLIVQDLFDGGPIRERHPNVIGDLYFDGLLEIYTDAIVTSYEKAVESNHNVLGKWMYSAVKWWYTSAWSWFLRLGFKYA